MKEFLPFIFTIHLVMCWMDFVISVAYFTDPLSHDLLDKTVVTGCFGTLLGCCVGGKKGNEIKR